MILAQVEYEAKDWEYGPLVDFRDRLEAALGSVFEIEQERVDIRMCPYGDMDDYSTSLFIHVQTDDDHDAPLQEIEDDLAMAIFDALVACRGLQTPSCRLWLTETTQRCTRVSLDPKED